VLFFSSRDNPLHFRDFLIGRTIVIDRTDLKNLLQQSAKYKDCTRIVLSKGPIPMRFRRGVKDEFPCVIEMN
jgi:hypothetical protein